MVCYVATYVAKSKLRNFLPAYGCVLSLAEAKKTLESTGAMISGTAPADRCGFTSSGGLAIVGRRGGA